MNDPIQLRKKLREILAMAPRRRFDERMLTDALNQWMPERVELDELRVAIEWNHARGFIEYRRNDDTERDEWFLTDEGKQKEGL